MPPVLTRPGIAAGLLGLALLAGCASTTTDAPRRAAPTAPPAPPPVAEPAPPAAQVPEGVTATPPPLPVGPADPVDAAARRGPSVDPVRGLASWYGQRFHGRRTASGERYDRNAFTAAHRTLPFGTRVRVRAVATGREVVVRINDRGPFKRSRVIDLSQTAFKALGLQGRGVAQVELLPE